MELAREKCYYSSPQCLPFKSISTSAAGIGGATGTKQGSNTQTRLIYALASDQLHTRTMSLEKPI